MTIRWLSYDYPVTIQWISQTFDLFFLMIIDLKRSIDWRWLFDPVLLFILRWSCFGCWQSIKINNTRVAKAALHQVKFKSESAFSYLACLSRLSHLSHLPYLSCLSSLSWLTCLLYFSPDVLTTDILDQKLLLKWFSKRKFWKFSLS